MKEQSAYQSNPAPLTHLLPALFSYLEILSDKLEKLTFNNRIYLHFHFYINILVKAAIQPLIIQPSVFCAFLPVILSLPLFVQDLDYSHICLPGSA